MFSTQREWDEGSGFYYYRSRQYSSELGRFLSRDSSIFLGVSNIYAYAVSAPVNYTDPSGYWIRDNWSASSGFALAEQDDTLAHLAYLITGDSRDQILLNAPNTITKGDRVNITPLLDVFEKRIRKNVVNNTTLIKGRFPRENETDYYGSNLTELRVNAFFDASLGDAAPACDCWGGATVVLAKGLIDTLKRGEFDQLYTSSSMQIISYSADTIDNMKLGDWGNIANDSRYIAKHPGGDMQSVNLIKVDEGQYWVYPMGAKSYLYLQGSLVTAFNAPGKLNISTDWNAIVNEGRGWAGLVRFFNIPAIGMDIFDYRKNRLDSTFGSIMRPR
mgnify:CR=1 FL=1